MENFITYLTKYNPEIEDIFSSGVKQTLNVLYKIVHEENKKIYLVGGIVRDIFLGRNSSDVDLVLEGDSQELAALVMPKFPVAKHRFNERFMTYNIFTKTGTNIDIAAFRTETYEHSGALPTVFPTSIENDYARRDFTINSMYISFDENATLYDPLNAILDIENKIIRVIHDKSFEDDPTRIFRAIKFAARYNFTIEKHTRELIKKAMEKNYLENISHTRLRTEIYNLLNEENIDNILKYFRDFQIFDFLNFPNPDDEYIEKIIDFIQKPVFKRLKNEAKISKGNFIIQALTFPLSYEEKTEALKIFDFSQKNIKSFVFEDRERQKLENFFSQKRSILDTFRCLSHFPLGKLMQLYFFKEEYRGKLEHYIFELHGKRAIICGTDLIKIGFKTDNTMRKYIDRCFLIQLSMKNPTKDKIIKQLLKELNSNE